VNLGNHLSITLKNPSDMPSSKEKKKIAISHKMKGGMLDDDYTLYNNGEILHEYDRHIYPGGSNLSEILSADQVSAAVKMRLLEAASENDKDLVKKLLDIHD
jgi:hypothetical protein